MKTLYSYDRSIKMAANGTMERKNLSERSSGLKTVSKKVLADMNVMRLERLVDALETEAKQMRASLDLYKRDPAKYKPQLDNFTNSANTIDSVLSGVFRTIDLGRVVAVDLKPAQT